MEVNKMGKNIKKCNVTKKKINKENFCNKKKDKKK